MWGLIGLKKKKKSQKDHSIKFQEIFFKKAPTTIYLRLNDPHTTRTKIKLIFERKKKKGWRNK